MDIKVLVFCVNGEYYATDIMEVERILGYETPTILPDSPEFLEGVINYEGSILPVMSFHKRFNLPSSTEKLESKIIVVRENEQKLGIVVDVVSEVKDIELSNIEVVPQVSSKISKRYLKGLIKCDGKIIIFLTLGNLLNDEEKSKL